LNEKIFFTSDNHYFHENIIKYCERPFSGSLDMNAEMMLRWNSVVGPDDIGIFVGDISAGLKKRVQELRDIIGKLNGKKILIRGNHDHQTDEWYIESGFFGVFDFLNLGGVILCHYPLRALTERGLDQAAFGEFTHVIHGHVHANTPNFEGHFNVAADRNDFMPWPYEDVMPESLRSAFRENIKNLLINTAQKKLTF
jgi:calcineurin-like phosphoesterase family protein